MKRTLLCLILGLLVSDGLPLDAGEVSGAPNQAPSTGALSPADAPASVTLRQAQGIEETIPRNAIASLTASKLSLMPQELEKGMTLQELADLLGYLKGEP